MVKNHMYSYKTEILAKICYTELVYARINKKLDQALSNLEIEKVILEIIENTEEKQFQKKEKMFISLTRKKILESPLTPIRTA